MILALLLAITLRPASHEIAQPGVVRFPLENAEKLRHTRWRGPGASGEWVPPQLTLSKPGVYWISAATPPIVRKLDPAAFQALHQAEQLDLIVNYRAQYKMEAKPVRLLHSTFAKTMLRIGPRESAAENVVLHLPVEFVLRAPSLVQLNFRGQPIAGIPVVANGKRVGVTNGAGQLPLAGLTGKLELRASVVRGYPDTSTADFEAFTATLTLPEVEAR